MLQILDDPSPTPPKDVYSSEFCSFISAYLQKDADARPTWEQLLSHPSSSDTRELAWTCPLMSEVFTIQ
uniref:Protein kinase domain-containing protein n=1 Tax=Arundo donax TaxID=35708 RepID=A0A0A9ECL9_ARUDO